MPRKRHWNKEKDTQETTLLQRKSAQETVLIQREKCSQKNDNGTEKNIPTHTEKNCPRNGTGTEKKKLKKRHWKREKDNQGTTKAEY